MACRNYEIYNKPWCSMFNIEPKCNGNGWKCDCLGGFLTPSRSEPTNTAHSIHIKPVEAEWTFLKSSKGDYTYQGCSRCGASQGIKTKYCPECGAKMKNGDYNVREL